VSDDIDVSGGEPIAPEGEVAPPPAAPIIKRGTLSRNVLLIFAGVIVVVVAAAFVILALQLGRNTAQPSGIPSVPVTTPVVSTPTSGTPSTVTSGAVPGLSTIDNDDVFTPRNPFVVIPPVAIVVPSSSSGSGSGSTDTSGTLYCTRITTVGGVREAVVRLNGISYTLAAGQQVDSSDYSIVKVDATEVLVSYGDVQFYIKPQASSSK
jgi:heme/copper-type cytochrome/quinol oxidase subunit 2